MSDQNFYVYTVAGFQLCPFLMYFVLETMKAAHYLQYYTVITLTLELLSYS